jgi:hypothetical protein
MNSVNSGAKRPVYVEFAEELRRGNWVDKYRICETTNTTAGVDSIWSDVGSDLNASSPYFLSVVRRDVTRSANTVLFIAVYFLSSRLRPILF